MKISKGEYYHHLKVKQYNNAVKLETDKLENVYLNMYKLCLETTNKSGTFLSFA